MGSDREVLRLRFSILRPCRVFRDAAGRLRPLCAAGAMVAPAKNPAAKFLAIVFCFHRDDFGLARYRLDCISSRGLASFLRLRVA
jgi:hypothetical protein